MCGIVGYVGPQAALDVVLGGLGRLERPGYDSAGVAVLADGGIAAAKTAGELADLRDLLRRRPLPTGGTAIGHIRRATHGAPTDANAHPQLDDSGRVAVVHDGVIDNHTDLRAELTGRGHRLVSQTDTEVVAHLLAETFSSCQDLAESMRQVCGALHGAFVLLAVHADAPEAVVAASRSLPLAVGIGDGESLVASDRAALSADRAAGAAVPAGSGGAVGVAEVVEVVEVGGDDGPQVVHVRREFDEVRCEVTDLAGGVVRA